jgi:hypothetical protein
MADAAARPPQLEARIAGLLYLIVIVLGLFSELAVRVRLIAPGDPAATAESLRAAEGLFRLGFAADVVMALCDVAIAVLLYVLLKPAGRTLALAATAFRLTQTAVLSSALLLLHAAGLLLTGAPSAFVPEPDAGALALFFLELHGDGYDLALLFFGVSNLILGALVWRAPYLPRAIGALLATAGVVYLAGGALVFLAPSLTGAFAPAYGVCIVAEAAFCLWLLLRGVDSRRWATALA